MKLGEITVMKHILFVESRESLPGVEACKEYGWKVTLLTQEPKFYLKNKSLSSRILRLVDNIIEAETNDEMKVQEFVKNYNEKNKLDAVLSYSELYVIQATKAAHSLGLVSMNPDATKKARNKYIMRKLCQKNSIPTPKFYMVNTLDEVLKAATDIGYPCVIKPCNGASGLGVQFANNPLELEQAFRTYFENRYFGRGLYAGNDLLIEEYLEGNLFSVETVTYNGVTQVLGITDRDLVGFPYFVENAATFPVSIPYQDEAIQMVKNCLNVLGVNLGACHTEIVITKQGPMIIEVNPRMGGGPIHELIYHATGIDLAKEILKMHVGEPPCLEPNCNRVASSKLFCPEKDGILVSVEGEEQVLAFDDVKLFETYRIGEKVSAPKSNFDWIGKLVVVGNDVSNTKKRMNEIERLIKFKIK